MAVWINSLLREGYKIREIFGQQLRKSKEIIVFCK